MKHAEESLKRRSKIKNITDNRHSSKVDRGINWWEILLELPGAFNHGLITPICI